jgi:hypothetical protein
VWHSTLRDSRVRERTLQVLRLWDHKVPKPPPSRADHENRGLLLAIAAKAPHFQSRSYHGGLALWSRLSDLTNVPSPSGLLA